MNKYADQISQVVNDLYGQTIDAELTRPEPKFGDYSTNVAMRLAKPLGRRPREIAEEIVEALSRTGVFSSVEIAGPGFINLRVSAKSLDDDLNAAFNGELPFGNNNDGAGRLCLVEYPSTNMAKPFSVGHLRSANQGWAARNLMLATGWKVITDNHLGDYGSPFGIWVVGFKKFSSEERLAERGIYELGDIYIKTKAAIKEEQAVGKEDLEREAQEWLLKLEHNDPEAVDYSNRFNQISLDHIHKVMGRLGISTDYELGEKFFAEKGKAAVQDLLEKGVAVKNTDGSVIVPLDEYGIETPMLVLKSNGAALYATTDLATMIYRDEEFHVDRVIYCVASEQKFYFEQLFAMAKKIGLNTELIHMWYGLIDQINKDGTREKMSSRKGVVLLEDLLDEAENRVRENSKSVAGTLLSDPTGSAAPNHLPLRKGGINKSLPLDGGVDENKPQRYNQSRPLDGEGGRRSLTNEVKASEQGSSVGISDEDIKKIAIGAIKFNDFSADRRTGMLFNWNTMFSLTGFSGPYVQYAAVRVNKILKDNGIFASSDNDPTGSPQANHLPLRKGGINKSLPLSGESGRRSLTDEVKASEQGSSVVASNESDYDYELEKPVILKLLDYPSIVKLAADNLEPHRIATYIYELAREMNRYYERTPIATADVPDDIKAARLHLLQQVAYVFNHGLTILGIEIPERM